MSRLAESLLTRLLNVDGFWYLATPYSKYASGLNEAAKEACQVTDILSRLGVNVFSPIAHSHAIAANGRADPLDHELWMRVDAPLMRAAHGLLVYRMPGWDSSVGVKMEVHCFVEAGKPVHHIGYPLEDLHA